MFTIRIWIIALCAPMASVSIVSASENFVWASQLASVIASAEPCGFQVDDDKIKELIANRTPDMDAMARQNFYATLSVTPRELDELSPSSKSAQCALQEAIAKQEGIFVQ